MSARRPSTAARSTALPSLAALLASGVVVDGCDATVDSAARQRRLTEHGQEAGRAFESGQLGRGAHEVAVGLGLVTAPNETRISAPGEAPPVQIETPIETAGAPVPTGPTPPEPSPVDVDGGIRPVTPTPPAQVTPPTPRAPHRPPHPPMHPRGGAPAVHPAPNEPIDP